MTSGKSRCKMCAVKRETRQLCYNELSVQHIREQKTRKCNNSMFSLLSLSYLWFKFVYLIDQSRYNVSKDRCIFSLLPFTPRLKMYLKLTTEILGIDL